MQKPGAQSIVASTSSGPPNILMPSVAQSGIWAFTTAVISGLSTTGTYVNRFSRYAESRVSGNEMRKKITITVA